MQTAQTQQNQQQVQKLSNTAKDKAEAARLYIERKYTKLKIDEKEKKQNWEELEKQMETMNLTEFQKNQIKQEIIQQEAEQLRRKRQKISPRDFDPIAIIGRGAFGEVRVCRCKKSQEILAIKKMKKNEMVFKSQVGHVRAERDVLATANNPWIVELQYSFQDEKYLYLVMEYLPGGDLMTLLMKKDILQENEAKFYIAETILAIESVHKMNYIHRDLKPDNILIDKNGHIKLSDFGLCKLTEIKPKINFGKKQEDIINQNVEEILTNLHEIRKNTYKRNRQLAFSTVGTPDYIAPEVFGQQGYTETVDFWSIGVILYEMLVGYPPFFSDDPSITCQKILQWKKTLVIPQEANLSQAASDLIKRLINDPNERLGVNGVQEIKFHPFFAGIEWKNIRNKTAFNVPDLKNEIDVSNFDKYEEEEPWITNDEQQKLGKKNRKQDINFIGYTFKRDIENERNQVVQAIENLEKIKPQASRSHINKPLTNNTQILNKSSNYLKTEHSQERQQQIDKKDAKKVERLQTEYNDNDYEITNLKHNQYNNNDRLSVEKTQQQTQQQPRSNSQKANIQQNQQNLQQNNQQMQQQNQQQQSLYSQYQQVISNKNIQQAIQSLKSQQQQQQTELNQLNNQFKKQPKNDNPIQQQQQQSQQNQQHSTSPLLIQTSNNNQKPQDLLNQGPYKSPKTINQNLKQKITNNLTSQNSSKPSQQPILVNNTQAPQIQKNMNTPINNGKLTTNQQQQLLQQQQQLLQSNAHQQKQNQQSNKGQTGYNNVENNSNLYNVPSTSPRINTAKLSQRNNHDDSALQHQQHQLNQHYLKDGFLKQGNNNNISQLKTNMGNSSNNNAFNTGINVSNNYMQNSNNNNAINMQNSNNQQKLKFGQQKDYTYMKR